MTDRMKPPLSPLGQELVDLARALNAVQRAKLQLVDPRDPDPSRPGIFALHNCWRCKDGTLPCAQGHTLNCEFPHARDD